MDLFNTETTTNILPFDGTVLYYGTIMRKEQADHYFNWLLSNVPWKNDEAFILGKHIITARKVAWFGDADFSYTYSKSTKQALPWSKELLELKKIAEENTGATYNSCLMNLYHNGNEGVSWHSDDEKSLERNGAIASLTFGAERKFSFKHKITKQTTSVLLEHGSLLVMKGATQQNWLHSLPKSKAINRPRINLTFRRMVG